MSYLPALDLRILETIVSDTYSITHDQPALLNALTQLRPTVQYLNSLTEILRQAIALHPSGGGHRICVYPPASRPRKTIHS